MKLKDGAYYSLEIDGTYVDRALCISDEDSFYFLNHKVGWTESLFNSVNDVMKDKGFTYGWWHDDRCKNIKLLNSNNITIGEM